MGVWLHPETQKPTQRRLSNFCFLLPWAEQSSENEASDDPKAKLLLLRDFLNGIQQGCHCLKEPLSNAFGSKHLKKKNKERIWASLLRNWCQKEESSRKREGHINSIVSLYFQLHFECLSYIRYRTRTYHHRAVKSHHQISITLRLSVPFIKKIVKHV